MASLPLRPCGLYWTYWAPIQRLVNFPTTYNVIFLFHATPVGGAPGTTGAVTLNKPTGAPGTNYNVDIQTCRSRGQRIIMTIGGANAQLTLNTQARADAFIASIKSINESLKVGTSLSGSALTTPAIDGIDWNNFESANISGQATYMTYAMQQLKAYYGSDFLSTAPPAAFGPTQYVSDRLLLATMYRSGALDWMCPQFYDPSNLNTVSNVRTFLDLYHTAVTVPADAFLGTSSASVVIPRNIIGIGFAVKSGASNSSRWGTSEAVSCYNTMTSEGKTQRGAFNWSSEEDPTSLFATNVGPTINPDLGGDTTAPTPGNSGTLTFTNVTDTSIRVNWSKATDDSTVQTSLQYEVRRSLSNNIASVANAEANGTIALAYTTDIATANITGLTPATTYYFNVIVKDAQSNKAVYTMNNQITTAPTTRTTNSVGSMTGVSQIII